VGFVVRPAVNGERHSAVGISAASSAAWSATAVVSSSNSLQTKIGKPKPSLSPHNSFGCVNWRSVGEIRIPGIRYLHIAGPVSSRV
jgi:hypothetical protein